VLRKLLVIGILVTLALTLLGVPVLAAAPANSSQTSTTMQGQGIVVGSREEPQLRIKMQATGTTDWLIEMALNPTRMATDSSGNQILDFSGSYTLGTPKLPLSTGTATGWINNSSQGDIKLVDSKTSASLDMTYTISNDGSVSSQVAGQWPSLPTSQPAQSAPAQPANHFFWYLSRTSGMLAYLLLFINVCLGLGFKSEFIDRKLGRWQAIDLHKFFGLLAMAFLGLHVFSLLGDKYFNLDMTQLLLPFAAPYRPLWTTMGVIAFYMALAVTLSSYFRNFVGPRGWRVIHYLAALLFVMTLFHSIMSGTDTGALWDQWLYISTGSMTVFLFLWRFKSHVFAWV